MHRQKIRALLTYVAVGGAVVISALWLYPNFRSEANLGRLEEEANSTDSATSYRTMRMRTLVALQLRRKSQLRSVRIF
jgi:hypothetical protein